MDERLFYGGHCNIYLVIEKQSDIIQINRSSRVGKKGRSDIGVEAKTVSPAKFRGMGSKTINRTSATRAALIRLCTSRA